MDRLFKNNNRWAEEKLKGDPDYFKKLSEGQSPESLIICCSDSRVPVNTIMKAEPGEFFIHRNIANCISANDLNILSVLEYAVDALKVKNIIVMGHYRCGGIKAAVTGTEFPLVESWVRPVKMTYMKNLAELEKLNDTGKALDRLAELNVIAQLENLALTPVLKKSFAEDRFPKLHGWVFDIYTGKIKELELPFSRWMDHRIIPVDYNFRS